MKDRRCGVVSKEKPIAGTEGILRNKDSQAGEERWVQDALEDDDVRESLRILHARDRNHTGKQDQPRDA